MKVATFLIFLPLFLFANPVINHWVAYSPSYNWQPGLVAESSLVWQDLRTLSWHNFVGIATYGALDSLHRVARYAKRLGFSEVIVGIWIDSNMVNNREGIKWAISAQNFADAYCVGNEVLFFHRLPPSINDTNYLRWAMDTIRQVTRKPVTTAEHWKVYDSLPYRDWLLRNCDFLFPIINPTDNGIRDPSLGARWVKGKFDSLRTIAGQKPVRIREAGWPTNSESLHHRVWANEIYQDLFFRSLDSLFAESLPFCFFFEAFDQFWKRGGTQPYWGLFDSARHAKLFAGRLGINWEDKRRGEKRNWKTMVIRRLTQEQFPIFDASGRKINLPKFLSPGIYLFYNEKDRSWQKFIILS